MKIKVRNIKTGATAWWSETTYKLNGDGYMGWVKVDAEQPRTEIPLKIEEFLNSNKKKDVPVIAESKPKNYEDMTFQELKDLAAEKGIKSTSKKGFIEKLKDYEGKE